MEPVPSLSVPPEHANLLLKDCVAIALERYFNDLDGEPPDNVYEMVLAEVERPLLEAVMKYTGGNQTRASELLGVNRGTLRKKLKHYGLG